MKRYLGLIAAVFIVEAFLYIYTAQEPSHRLERLAFQYLLPPIQRIIGVRAPTDRSFLYGFVFEKPESLHHLKATFHWDKIVAKTGSDFDAHLTLMHWVRDHSSEKSPGTTAAQLLIQAIASSGGFARQLDLRFTAEDAHSVVEAWSEFYKKWIVLDPNYDIYYTRDGVPLHALDLHEAWRDEAIDQVKVHHRESDHNLYFKNYEKIDRNLIYSIYKSGDLGKWDDEIAKLNPHYHENARFGVKLLNYYSQISYPLRNDWLSRPLPWWHPEGNHVQNSLVIQLDSMRDDEDFLHKITDPSLFYHSPIRLK